MTDPRDLIGLSYCSTATFEATRGSFGVHPQVNRILVQSRRNNRRREVGGMLHFGNEYFFQYLEGEVDVVDRLFARIREDERHREVRQLTRMPIEARRFEDWSMKFVVLERIVDRVLERAGLDRFDPYAFTPAVVEALVAESVRAPDADPSAGHPDGAGSAEAEERPRRRGLFARWLGR